MCFLHNFPFTYVHKTNTKFQLGYKQYLKISLNIINFNFEYVWCTGADIILKLNPPKYDSIVLFTYYFCFKKIHVFISPHTVIDFTKYN